MEMIHVILTGLGCEMNEVERTGRDCIVVLVGLCGVSSYVYESNKIIYEFL